jgi:hypothetical protein
MALYRESFIFRLETDEPAMFWTGHGDLPLAADDVLSEPAVALGGGDLVNLPDLEQLINGTAQRVEVTLSGVSQRTAVLASEEAPQVNGAPAYIGRVQFDEAWQQQGPVVWEWSGEGRGLTVSGDDGEDGRTRSLTLKLGSGDTTRSRAPLAFFTDADQRRDFPTDTVFSHVAAINAGTSRRWGPS